MNKGIYLFHGKDISVNMFIQIRDVIHEIASRKNLPFEEVIADFYSSKTYRAMADTQNGLWAESAPYIADQYFLEKTSKAENENVL